jgi:hypothetical protein
LRIWSLLSLGCVVAPLSKITLGPVVLVVGKRIEFAGNAVDSVERVLSAATATA